jgi:hypothetical protein
MTIVERIRQEGGDVLSYDTAWDWGCECYIAGKPVPGIGVALDTAVNLGHNVLYRVKLGGKWYTAESEESIITIPTE